MHREFVGGDGRTWSDETGSWEVRGGKLPPPEPDGVWLDATAWELLQQYAAASRTIAMWKDLQRQAKDALVKIMGPAQYGHYCGQRVVCVARTRPKRFNQSAFAEANPGLWEAFREEAETEEVRLSIPKDADIPAPPSTGDTA